MPTAGPARHIRAGAAAGARRCSARRASTPFADARLRAAPGELGPRAPDAQRPLHVAEGVRPLLWAAPGGLVLGGLVLGSHVPGLLAGAVPVLAPRAGFGLHRGALAAAAQMIGTGGRRGVHCRRPRPPATGSSRRATAMRRTDAHRTAHRRATHCALTQSARALCSRRKSHAAPTQLRQRTAQLRLIFTQLRRNSHAIASDLGRNCVGFWTQLRHDLRVSLL